MNDVLVVDMCSKKDSLHYDEFVVPVEQIIRKTKKRYDIIHFMELDADLVKKYGKIILCGVALKDYDYLDHLEKFEWIRWYNGYLLGICAGAQVIGRVFGAKIKEGCEIGLIDIRKLKDDVILNDANLLQIYALHNSYTEVPAGFSLLLETKYPQLFTNGKIYASLFHPEIRNKNLIRNFIDF